MGLIWQNYYSARDMRYVYTSVCMCMCIYNITCMNTRSCVLASIDYNEKRACNIVPTEIQTEAKNSNKLSI